MTLTVKNEFIIILFLGLLLLALIAAGVEGLPAPLLVLRLLLGLIYVLFVPGYALQAALFPQGEELDGPERLALSFTLSAAVMPLLALALDRLPWGLRLVPVVVAEGVFIATFSVVALWRRSRLPPGERPAWTVAIDPRGWWAAQDRVERFLYGVVALALLLAAGSAAALVLLPDPGERLTEFYILGAEGLAEWYPFEGVAGQPLTVTVGITNREGSPQRYRVDVRNGVHTIGAAGPIALEHEGHYQAPLAFAPVEVGEDVQVQFLLFREEDDAPYRSLRLWLKVRH
jgi:uncharacterized membrane protein